VIASTGTPWSELVQHGCGRWVSNDPTSLTDAIREMQTRDIEEMGMRGRQWMQSDFTWAAVAKRMQLLYGTLCE